MKRVLSFLLCLCMVLSLVPITARAADGIAIDSTNFPDVNFRNYLLNLDVGSDGVLTEEEIGKITSLYPTNRGIKDLTGIEYFTALTRLECYRNQLTELDVSQNTALTSLSCGDNQLTELDVSKNTALIKLSCYGNQLTSLDLSQNANLGTLETSGNVYTITVGTDRTLDLTMLPGNFDVRKASEWVGGTVEGNILTIDSTVNKVTYTYQVSSANSVSFTIKVRNSDVAINEDNFPDANFRNYLLSQTYGADGVLTNEETEDITDLYLGNKGIRDLTGIEWFPWLTYLTCYSNRLTKLDLSQNKLLAGLSCYDNQLTELNLSQNTKLTRLYCYDNQLAKLDLSKNTALTELSCGENQLTALDLSQNTKLTELSCGESQLTSLDLSENTALEHLYCPKNQLTELNVSKNAKLTTLYCYDNQLAELDVSQNILLNGLKCYNNQLTKLDMSKNTALTYLSCYKNQLTELNVSQNAALTYLSCSHNQLTELDLSNTYLTNLYCSHNQLTKLDVSKNTKLSDLSCYNNRLTSLDLSKNTKVSYPQCYDNVYNITVDGKNQMDLTTLPGNFDVNKASDWEGGTVNGNILTATAHTITYTYQLNDTYSREFTLQLDSQCADADNDGKCDICGEVMRDIVRLSGKDRYKTAMKVADELKETLGVWQFDTIIVASGANFADALAGSYLASKKNAPILLCGKGEGVNSQVVEYIKQNLAWNGTVYILGGTAAVPSYFENALRGYGIVRLSGKNRYETSQKILTAAGIYEGEEILVCTGENYADSLSASATGKPILLACSKNGKLNGLDDAFLSGLSGCWFTIIGGTSAVDEQVAEKLSNYGYVERISGKTRYQTSVLVAERYFYQPEKVVLAYGHNFPDGLCGGVLAYNLNAPLVLTKTGSEGAATAYATGKGISSGYVLGGEKLISDETAKTILGKK